jgi:hypothetical protein
MIELKNSKTQYLGRASGRDRYSLDAFTGAVQMREPGGPWQDIRPCLVRDADGWHVEGAPYYAEIKDDGSRLFCPDRNERNKYLSLPAPALFAGLGRDVVQNPTKLDRQVLPNQITMPTAWGEYRIIFSPTGMHFEVLFREAPPSAVFGQDSPRILLDADAAGIDIDRLLKSKEGLGVPRPRLVTEKLEVLESPFQELWLNWTYKNGQMELGFDFGELAFPILLKNTTVDVQVGSGEDDGWTRSDGVFNNGGSLSYAGVYSGSNTLDSFYRFTGITIPQGSTISVCYSSHRGSTSGSPLTKVYFEKAQDPGAITSRADYVSRTLTSAGVDWDETFSTDWHNSPSLVTPMQELIDAYGLSDQAIQEMHKDDGSSAGSYMQFYTYDQATEWGAQLHIEYTGGGATPKTVTETGCGAENSLLKSSMSRADTAKGADVGQSLLASLIKNESGAGVEQSLLESLAARLSADTGSGSEAATLIAGLAVTESGFGVDVGWLVGLKSILSEDGGIAADALKALVGTSSTGSEMKLPGRQREVKIPSKGVSL